MFHSRFDDIRPYREHEISDAMQRIAESPIFNVLADYIFPDRNVDDVRKMVRGITTSHEFQAKVMRWFNAQVIRRSITDFKVSGLEKLAKNRAYLMVSNHRDIVLDSSLLQYALLINGYNTTDITFGANLMCSPLVIDIGKSNKMFRVERASNSREFLIHSRHLSDFIYTDIATMGRSVWIAQRNGRTKNGIDATDPGIIKMFCLTGKDPINTLKALNIVPVAVSYEWEPCDVHKAVELLKSRHEKYVKKEGEDLESILTGILQPKGKVHFEVCDPLDLDKEQGLHSKSKNDLFRAVAALIDSKINRAYHLMPSNFIAHDLRSGTDNFASHYTQEEKQAFAARMDTLLAECAPKLDSNDLRSIFLDIYANSVDNHIR